MRNHNKGNFYNINYRTIISYSALALFCGFLVFSYFRGDHEHASHEHSNASHHTAQNSLSEAEIRDIVKDVILTNPSLILESVENHYKEKILAEKTAIKEKLVSLKNKIFDNLSDPRIGNGKIKVVQFFDYACGYCKKSAAMHKKLLESDPDLQIVFKEMPIMSPLSIFATKAALAVNMIDSSKYQAFQASLLGTNLTDEEVIIRLAGENGIDPIKLKEVMGKPEIDNIIQDNLKLATDLHIKGTPAYIIEDEIVPGAVSYNDLRAIIDGKKESNKVHSQDSKKSGTDTEQ